MIRFQVPAAICAAGAAAMAVAVAPAAHADDIWGAIAVSPDGMSNGASSQQPTEQDAKNVANYDCDQNQAPCNIVVTFSSPDCGAIAQKVTKRGITVMGATGSTRTEAENAAIARLGTGSRLLSSTCATD